MKNIISDFDIPELNIDNIDLDSIKNDAKNKLNNIKNNFNFDF